MFNVMPWTAVKWWREGRKKRDVAHGIKARKGKGRGGEGKGD
jgi:hypothetical protein